MSSPLLCFIRPPSSTSKRTSDKAMASLFTYSRRDGSASGTQAVYQAALSRLASASAQDELLETFARVSSKSRCPLSLLNYST